MVMRDHFKHIEQDVHIEHGNQVTVVVRMLVFISGAAIFSIQIAPVTIARINEIHFI